MLTGHRSGQECPHSDYYEARLAEKVRCALAG
jgi:hypothetical protein